MAIIRRSPKLEREYQRRLQRRREGNVDPYGLRRARYTSLGQRAAELEAREGRQYRVGERAVVDMLPQYKQADGSWGNRRPGHPRSSRAIRYQPFSSGGPITPGPGPYIPNPGPKKPPSGPLPQPPKHTPPWSGKPPISSTGPVHPNPSVTSRPPPPSHGGGYYKPTTLDKASAGQQQIAAIQGNTAPQRPIGSHISAAHSAAQQRSQMFGNRQGNNQRRNASKAASRLTNAARARRNVFGG